MNTNNIKTQNKVWPQRPLKITKGYLKISKLSFSAIYFCLTLNLFVNFSRMSTLWRFKFLIKWSMASKVIQGYIRPLLCKNYSSTFVYGPILMKICMNANIMKTQFFHWIICDLKFTFMLLRSFVIFYFKTFWSKYNLDLRSNGHLWPCLILDLQMLFHLWYK